MSKQLPVFDFDITKSDFDFVQANDKIKDEKFKTKTTTFLKDAIKRFGKNKSSVAGAIILGILMLLIIFVPLFSQANISKTSIEERFLAPKLFEAGTGFWDGTRVYKNIIYDYENDKPANYRADSVISLDVDDHTSFTNNSSKFGKGGFIWFINETNNANPEDLTTYEGYTRSLYFYKSVEMKASDNITVKIVLNGEDAVTTDVVDYERSPYRVVLYDGDSADTRDVYVLKDWNTDAGEFTLNISKALSDAGVSEVSKGRFAIELKAGNMKQSYMLIQSIEFSSQGENKDFLDNLSFTDANSALLRTIDEATRIFPDNYIQCTGQKLAYKVEVTFCTFVYDTYNAAYGLDLKEVAKSDIDTYVRNGWCTFEYDKTTGEFTFEKLSDKCPIDDVASVRINPTTKKVLSVYGGVYRYRQYGYTSMPIFLFGTNQSGFDLVTIVFKGLQTSLILGLCTAAFCFCFGLVWGAISGYFGGNVDLAMERFCEILGGVPWIVVMTLCILNLGNNFGTFFLALCLTGWMGTAGTTRTQFYRFKGREYILSSRTLGASDMRLIFKHILPNSMGTIITGSVLMIPSVIYSEATLSYLNLGLRGLDSFGIILSENQKYIQIYPNLILFPSVVMALMMISFNLFGNGLRDAFNPSLKGSE